MSETNQSNSQNPQRDVKFLDKHGLSHFWHNAKDYIDYHDSLKIDKVTGPEGNIPVLDGTGNLEDTGMHLVSDSSSQDYATNPVTGSAVDEVVNALGDEVDELLEGKADKAVPSAVGNVPTLDAEGNLADSGYGIADDVADPVTHAIDYETFRENIPTGQAVEQVVDDKVSGEISGLNLADKIDFDNTPRYIKTLSQHAGQLEYTVGEMDDTPQTHSNAPVTSQGIHLKFHDIETLIPPAASSDNQLADKEYVDSLGERIEARYLGSDVNGNPFASYASFVDAQQNDGFYYNGERVQPNNNDVIVVTSDETHLYPPGDEHGTPSTTRYHYQGDSENGQWCFEYVINNSALNRDQLLAVNSGITPTKVQNYDAHLLDQNNPHHVTASQVGLGNADNTADLDKPISTATQTALDTKVDKLTGAHQEGNIIVVGNSSDAIKDSGASIRSYYAPEDNRNPATGTAIKQAIQALDPLTVDPNPSASTNNFVTSVELVEVVDPLDPDYKTDYLQVNRARPVIDNIEGLTDALAEITGDIGDIVAGKADKDEDAVVGNVAEFDENGNPVDSGHALSEYKTKQSKITVNPESSTNSLTFLTSFEQNANGEITNASAATIPDASTSIKGVVQLTDSTSTTSSTLAATATAVKTAYDRASSLINDLDAEVTSTDGTNVQVKVTQVDGEITEVNVFDNTTSAISDTINALDATVRTDDSETGTAPSRNIDLTITQSDGVLTGITVNRDDSVNAGDLASAISTAVGNMDATVRTDSSETGTADNRNIDLTVTQVDGVLTGITVNRDETENRNNKVFSFQSTPDDAHYPSEKLVKDYLDNKETEYWIHQPSAYMAFVILADITDDYGQSRIGSTRFMTGILEGYRDEWGYQISEVSAIRVNIAYKWDTSDQKCICLESSGVPKMAYPMIIRDARVQSNTKYYFGLRLSTPMMMNFKFTGFKSSVIPDSIRFADINFSDATVTWIPGDGTNTNFPAGISTVVTSSPIDWQVGKASQLITSRELAVLLSNNSTNTVFDGSTAVTNIKVRGTLGIENGGTGATNAADALANLGVTTALDGKADKVVSATDGNFAGLDANGNLTDSGSKAADFATAGHVHGNITNDGKIGSTSGLGVVTSTSGLIETKDFSKSSPETGVGTTTEFIDTVSQGTDGEITATKKAITHASTSAAGIVSLSSDTTSTSETEAATPLAVKTVKDAVDGLGNNKADKVSNATNGNFAGLDASGNLTDSGKTASDFATSAQGTKADSAIQGVKVDGTALTPDANKVVSIPDASISGKGTVQLSSATDSTSETAAATPKAVKLAYDRAGELLAGLDNTETSTDGTNVQVKVTQVDGAITAVNVTTDNTENRGNKVTSWSSTTTDTHYPSETLVKESLDEKANKSEMSVTPGTGADSDKTTITLKTGTSATVLTTHQDISGKADKVSGATSGNFAGLDTNGNITDSGSKAADFATASQGGKADTAVQDVKIGNTSLVTDNVASLPDATTLVKGVVQLTDSHTSTSTTTAATPKNVKEAYDLAAGKAAKVSGATSGNLASLDSSGDLVDSGIAANNVKTKQTAVNDPDASGTTITAIDTISQNANGEITATKKTIRSGTTSQTGVVQLSDAVNSTSTSLAATANAVKKAYDHADSLVNSLDVSSVGGAGKYISAISETDGKISATETTMDTVPTDNSTNAVTSGGVKAALDVLADRISGTGFEIVDLTTGADPHPDVTNPSVNKIYLTKDSGSTAEDPYTEWIYIAPVAPAIVGTWQVIGETSMDLSGYKTVQTAVSDPTASGTTLTAIDTISQNANGEITATKKTIPDGTTSQKGVVTLTDSHTSTSTTTAATPKSVKEAYDLASGKADKVSGATEGNFAALDANGDLSDSGKKASDFKTVQSNVDSTGSTIKTLTRIQQNTNGEITTTFEDIQEGTSSQKGVVKLDTSMSSGSTSLVPTTKLVKDALDTKVAGPSSSTDSDIAVFDGTTGKTIKDSGKKLSDLAYNNFTQSIRDANIWNFKNDWYKVASTTLTKANDNISACFELMHTHYGSSRHSRIILNVRNDSSGTVPLVKTANIYADENTAVNACLVTRGLSGETVSVELWLTGTASTSAVISLVDSTHIDSMIPKSDWTFTSYNGQAGQPKPTADASANITVTNFTVHVNKHKQTAVSDTTASGTTLTAIATISQNENGVITATKKTIQDGTTSQKGVVQLSSTAGSDEDKAATPKLVSDSVSGKADKVTTATEDNFASFDASGNIKDSDKKASDFKPKQQAVTVSGLGTAKTITAMSQTADGVISVTASDIRSATTGQTGIVQLNNTVTSTSTTQAATANAVKTAYDHADSVVAGLDVDSVGGAGKYISAISETDGKISATATTMDTTPTANSTNVVTSGGIKTALDTKVAGPSSATDDDIAVFDGTTGKLVKDGGKKISDLALNNSVISYCDAKAGNGTVAWYKMCERNLTNTSARLSCSWLVTISDASDSLNIVTFILDVSIAFGASGTTPVILKNISSPINSDNNVTRLNNSIFRVVVTGTSGAATISLYFKQGGSSMYMILREIAGGITNQATTKGNWSYISYASANPGESTAPEGNVYKDIEWCFVKELQTAVSDPTASGTALSFIDSITQNANGEITPTKKNVTIDSTPTASSENPVSSGGVKTALDDKVNVASILLENQSTTLLSIVQSYAGTENKHYARWYTKSDGGTKLTDLPVSRKGFVCEAICSRWVSASDYVYQLTLWSKEDTNPYVAIVKQSTTAISWSHLNTQTITGVKGDAESSYRTGNVNLTPANLGISATSTSVTVGSTTFNQYVHPTTSGNKHVPSGGSSGQFLGWDSDGTAKWVNNPNTDTKVKATAKTDNVNYKILATASASPTSGNATEAVYDVDITLNPSTNTIAANISGNAATSTKPKYTSLTSTDDLNNAVGSVHGDVMWYQWASGSAPANVPTTGTSEMEVVRMHDGNYCTQTVYVANNETVYRRINKNGTWGSWYSYSKSNHGHGNIQNSGALQTTDITIASGDKLVVTDASDSNKVARTSISFDGSTETTALTPKGTWVSFVRRDAEVTYTGGNGIDITGSGTTRTVALNVSSIPEATIKSLVAALS